MVFKALVIEEELRTFNTKQGRGETWDLTLEDQSPAVDKLRIMPVHPLSKADFSKGGTLKGKVVDVAVTGVEIRFGRLIFLGHLANVK